MTVLGMPRFHPVMVLQVDPSPQTWQVPRLIPRDEGLRLGRVIGQLGGGRRGPGRGVTLVSRLGLAHFGAPLESLSCTNVIRGQSCSA